MAFVAVTPLTKSNFVGQSQSVSKCLAFQTPFKTPATRAAQAAKASTMALTKPPQTVLSPLPRLLVYDHCPFCLRVRYVLGVKNVKYQLIWLMNDDVETPTALVGKKMVPIFQADGKDGHAIVESLDICKLIDSTDRFGPTGQICPDSNREDLSTWIADISNPMRRLTRPRYARAPLPEFVFADGREAYIRNHPLADPSDYDENFARSAEYMSDVEAKLETLVGMIHSPECCTEGGISYDDVVLFTRLQALTLVKGLNIPSAVRAYLDVQSKLSEVPLYDYCAM